MRALLSNLLTKCQMLSRRLVGTASRLVRGNPATATRVIVQQQRCYEIGKDPAINDPSMNGGYVNPPPVKRALRDPYADWWDKQERRNFGEPVHEDNDILGVFSTEPYTHSTPGKAGLHFGIFVVAFLGMCAGIYQIYPDRPSAPKEYPGGLETELGGSRALVAPRRAEEELN